MNRHLQRMLAPRLQLGDFWDDVIDMGEEAARAGLRRLGNRVAASPGVDHIPEQNRVVGEFSRVLDAVNTGRITRSQGAADIAQLLAAFDAYIRIVGTYRAARGLSDVQRLASQIISNLGGPAAPAPDGRYYYVTSGGLFSSSSSLGLVAVVGVGALLLWGRK